jgi:preprotein translocase subunit SecF
MKRVIHFSRGFIPAAIVSTVLILSGICGYIGFRVKTGNGFNLGVDFQAGLMQEVQFAPTAFSLTYTGGGNASVDFTKTSMSVILSGAGVNAATNTFSYAQYPTLAQLQTALQTVAGISVEMTADAATASNTLLQSASSDTQLGSTPYVVHFLPPGSKPIPIEDVRKALSSLGSASVQSIGADTERHFQIRMQSSSKESDSNTIGSQVVTVLEKAFGAGNVAVITSNFVGSQFSQTLTTQAAILVVLTLLLILVYVSFRFKPQFAIGAVLAIAHDALIMVAFFVWTRTEFNTTSIAAILTILGYSINDTIVIFDRIREDRGIHPDEAFLPVMDRAITETLSRTIITTLTTMLAVLSLFIFTTGTNRDFAGALLVGMTSGCYSTVFIACGFANFWQVAIIDRKKAKAKAKLIAENKGPQAVAAK